MNTLKILQKIVPDEMVWENTETFVEEHDLGFNDCRQQVLSKLTQVVEEIEREIREEILGEIEDYGKKRQKEVTEEKDWDCETLKEDVAASQWEDLLEFVNKSKI